MVAVTRRALGIRAVGHAGTLDPFATGLLVVLVGKATRLARFVEAMRKRYRATVRFGTATDTDDATGHVVETGTADAIDAMTIAGVLPQFVGTTLQVPPAYSAKHVDGARSHRLARAGRRVALAAQPVTIDAIDVVSWKAPDLDVDVVAGKGTYIRALARDIGVRAGVPAHCAELRRTAIGNCSVDRAIAPEAITASALLPPETLLPAWPVEELDGSLVREIGFGRAIRQRREHADGYGALMHEGALAAVARGHDGWWRPVVVFAEQA